MQFDNKKQRYGALIGGARKRITNKQTKYEAVRMGY